MVQHSLIGGVSSWARSLSPSTFRPALEKGNRGPRLVPSARLRAVGEQGGGRDGGGLARHRAHRGAAARADRILKASRDIADMAGEGGEPAMAAVQPWAPIINERIWTQEEKDQWLAAHDDGADPRGDLRAAVPDRTVRPAVGAPRAPDRPFGRRLGRTESRWVFRRRGCRRGTRRRPPTTRGTLSRSTATVSGHGHACTGSPHQRCRT